MEIGFIVLAGGKSLRLGCAKALETVDNISLIKRVVSSLSIFQSDIIIVTATKQFPLQFTNYPKSRIVTDIYPNRGPLGGIYTGLTASNLFYNLVVACDMPFLNQSLLNYMIQISDGFDLVAPRCGNMVEPLHAVYSKDCLIPIEHLLKQGNLKIYKLFPLVKAKYVEATDINRFDPEHLSFFNVNTEADLETAREIARGNTNNDKR